MNFFEFGAVERLGKENKLLKLNQLIDWKRLDKHFKGLYKKDIEDKGGQRPYDPIKMFKAILLGQWHSLSDPELEESLRVRLDFMLFTGFELGEDLPDETTLCRFRNRLIAKGLDKPLFEAINRQLEKLGLKVKACDGAVVDATIVESASRPNRVLEPSADGQTYELKESADPDARWLKKGKHAYFGYRGYARTDSDQGYIESTHVKPANEAETKELAKAVEGSHAKRIYADKGFASKANREMLKNKGFADGIMEKAVRGRKLSLWQKLKNKLISKKRFIVERAFGTLKRQLKMFRASYRTREKVEGQFRLKALCYNLLKAANAVQIG